MDDLGEKIALQRKKMGLSQEELGFRLGVSRQTVSRWEANASIPTIENIKALGDVFEIGIDYFIGNKDKRIAQEAAISSSDKKKKYLGLKLGIALITLILAISVFITAFFGINVFPSNKGDHVVNSNNIMKEDFYLSLMLSIALLVADVTMGVVLIIKKRM